MINDYTLQTSKSLAERIEKFTNSQALNVAGEFTYGARIVRHTQDGEFVYEKYRGGYTKGHPDYYLVDTTLRHAQVSVSKSDIDVFEEAIKAFESAMATVE